MPFETDLWPYVPARIQKKVSGKRHVRGICIHDMEAPEKEKTAENVAKYFQSPQTGGSAHICIDSDSVVQCVLDNNVAAAAPGANHDMIHIELAGYAKQTREEWLDAYSVAMLTLAADVTAQYCLKYDIPPVHLFNDELRTGKSGIVGHYQVTEVYKKSTHTDPGKNFPWDFFIERVAGRVAARSAAVKDDNYEKQL